MSMRSTNPLFHLGYWIFVLLTLTLVFGSSWGSRLAAFYFITMLLPIVLGTSYFFNYVLVPKYYFTGKYFKFGLYSIYAIIISLYLEMVVLMFSFIYLSNFRYENMNPNAADSIVLAMVLYFLVFLGSFFLMTNQIREKQQMIDELVLEKEKMANQFLELISNRKLTKIAYSDILYIESLSDYIKVHTESEDIISKEKISKIAERLPEAFIRIHRSFIINRDKVKQFSYDEVVVADIPLTIGRSYRKEARQRLTTFGADDNGK